MVLKLNIRKTYDWVEWNFLRLMMERMGFAYSWVDLIMRCIVLVFLLDHLEWLKRGEV